MKKYAAPVSADESRLNDAPASDTLEFPVAPEFRSQAPRIDSQAMLRRIEENMPWRSTRPGEQERRRAEIISVEFFL